MEVDDDAGFSVVLLDRDEIEVGIAKTGLTKRFGRIEGT